MLFLAVERTPSAIASLWLCFQAIWKRFIISRKCLKVFILKTSSERVSVCVRSCGSVAAEKAAASIHRVPAPWFLCCLVSAALGEGLCCRIKAMHWADPRTGRIHSIQVRARTERCKWKPQPYSPEVCVSLKPWHRLNFWWLQQGISGWVTVPAHSGCWIR